VVQLLITAEADLNLHDEGGWTALMIAGPTVVQLLLHARANPNLQDKNKRTALMKACNSAGRNEVVQLLITAGADLNTQDKDEWTPLMLASCAGRTEVVQLLIAGLGPGSAALNSQEKEGLTPLMLASYAGHDEVVQLLINARADPDMQDKVRTPVMPGWRKRGSHALSRSMHTWNQHLLPTFARRLDEQKGWTALSYAKSQRHDKVVQLLEDQVLILPLDDVIDVLPWRRALTLGVVAHIR